MMREYVRTVDRDARLHDRPPFERTIELKKGIGSDLQAFGYEAAAEGEEAMLRLHSPWYLFRQEPFPGTTGTSRSWRSFGNMRFSSIRVLDIIPGEQTWPATE